MLHQEYLGLHPDGYARSRFGTFIRQYLDSSCLVMHLEHKAGDKQSIIDRDTGEVLPVEIFVAILPCSQLTYVEAVMSQRKEDLIRACENSLLFYGARNYLLTNDKYGNLLWFTAVVTSLELEPDPLATYNVCDNCKLCVELCPSGELLDENNFSQIGCRKVCYVTVKGILELRCWKCRNICPYKHGITE